MEITHVTVISNGSWDEKDVYSNYDTTSIEISPSTTLIQLSELIAATIDVDENLTVGNLSLYKVGSEKRKTIILQEDRDVHMVYNWVSTGMCDACCIIADIIPRLTPIYNINTPDISTDLKVGSMLANKDELKKTLCKLALKRSFQFKTPKSSQKQFYARCVHENCDWYVRASVYKSSKIWVIRKFIDVHTCPMDAVHNDHKQATPLVLAEYAESLIRMHKKKTCTPEDLMKYVQKNYGVNISYYKAMKAKEKALEGIRGKPEDSYACLENFAARLIEKNPGTYTAHEADDDNRFKYFFMSMAASIQGWKHCLPAISVDGASLKNKFAGTLITACTFDGNQGIYPLAFAVVDSENDASWGWFFTNLKAVFGDHKDLVIVSDQHPSIENGFNEVYGEAHQAVCIYRLLQNIKPDHCSEAFVNMYFNCAKAYTPEMYEYYIRQLEQMSPNVRARLEKAEPQRWARAFALKNRYVLMTANVSESLNAHLIDAYDLPIIPMLEAIRDFMQHWFYERRNDADCQQLDISKRCAALLHDHLAASRKMDLLPINNSHYEVRGDHKHFEVNIVDRTCTCKEWQMDLIPCSHACLVITRKDLNLHSFVHDFYKTSTLKELYRGDIRPIGTSHRIVPSDREDKPNVQPPNIKRPIGRPCKKSICSHNEMPANVKCSRCGRLGHNKRTCKNPI